MSEKENLRDELLDYIYAGAFSGMPSMILEQNRIQDASPEELQKIAKEYGIQ